MFTDGNGNNVSEEYIAGRNVYHADYIKTLKMYLGTKQIPIYIKTAIAALSKKAGLDHNDLFTGAHLEEETSKVQSAVSNPSISTLEKGGGFFGVSVATLLENRQGQSISITIGHNSAVDIKVDGDCIVSSVICDKKKEKASLAYDIKKFLYCLSCEYPGHPQVLPDKDRNRFVCPHCGRDMIGPLR